jgi:hypothetical protein
MTSRAGLTINDDKAGNPIVESPLTPRIFLGGNQNVENERKRYPLGIRPLPLPFCNS